MDLGLISVRYARALLKFAESQNCAQQVYHELLEMDSAMRIMTMLKDAIENPMLSKDKKLDLLNHAVSNPLSDVTQSFFKLVTNKKRDKIISQIINAYITLYRKNNNIISGKLITATHVSEETELKMRKMVESKTNGNVEFQTEVNPDIIGGFILEYNTYRMDASVKRKLSTILTQLSK